MDASSAVFASTPTTSLLLLHPNSPQPPHSFLSTHHKPLLPLPLPLLSPTNRRNPLTPSDHSHTLSSLLPHQPPSWVYHSSINKPNYSLSSYPRLHQHSTAFRFTGSMAAKQWRSVFLSNPFPHYSSCSGSSSEPETCVAYAGSGKQPDPAPPVSARKLQDPPSGLPSAEMEMSQLESKSNGVLNDLKDTSGSLECFGTGSDVECVVVNAESEALLGGKLTTGAGEGSEESFLGTIGSTLLLISPFFFWGTSMVSMKQVLPKAGPFFVAATRLIPAGALLIAFAALRGRKQPSRPLAWISILAFGLVDAFCFQGFLTEGLKRTSAGLGSVIIDSQPLTVAVLAAIFFGETIGTLGGVGLVMGIVGLLLLEVPLDVFKALLTPEGLNHIISSSTAQSDVTNRATWSIWESGEWWMLLAAQSMAVGTVMVRWVCQYSDPIMATGWHMILGGIPLLLLSAIQHDPALNGHIQDLDLNDWLSLLYTSVFGSAISYGVFFYKATTGSLTRLSSLTFLTPVFATLFGYFFLGEVLSPLQFVGATVTLSSIYLVNAKSGASSKELDE